LLFSLRKFKQSPEPIQTTASCEVGRNPENHLRVIGILVELKLGVSAARLEYLDRVFKQFRDFCTVSSSVSLGIPVRVTVIDVDGVKVFEGS
jgi:organic hydroperoxide reductase OsmC/OhrA